MGPGPLALSLLTVDPGVHTGWALAIGGVLVDFGTVNGVHWRGEPPRLFPACVCVVEYPRVYPSVAKWKGDPQDLVRLAYLAGRIAAQFPVSYPVEPRAWQRGSPPEHVLRNRTRALLRPEELCLVESRRVSAHAWDAIGILVYSLDRRI
jgi:hypothetical protein